MQKNTRRKYVAPDINPFLALHFYNLWSYVAGSPASVLKIWLLIADGGQPEIYQNRFPTLVGGEHDIFEFKIAVHDTVFVEVGESFEDSSDEVASLTEGESFVGVDSVEKGASGEERGDDIDAVRGLDDAVYFEDVRMIDYF